VSTQGISSSATCNSSTSSEETAAEEDDANWMVEERNGNVPLGIRAWG
jgi:hypothetical protein